MVVLLPLRKLRQKLKHVKIVGVENVRSMRLYDYSVIDVIIYATAYMVVFFDKQHLFSSFGKDPSRRCPAYSCTYYYNFVIRFHK